MASTLTVDNIVGATSSDKIHIPGHVIQVVQSTITATPSTTSTSFVDTGLSVTITPTSSSSKILVMADYGTGAGSTAGGLITQLLKGSTVLFYRGDAYSSAGSSFGAGSFNHLDSPATTSAITYKIQYKTQSASSTAYFNIGYTGGGYTAPTSHLTVMEIAQ